MILDFKELLDIVIMTVVVGYIFTGIFNRFAHDRYQTGFDWKSFKFSCLVTAPAIILHELGHKFVALGFGLGATFHAAYVWLGIGTVLRALNTGFIFFVPAYVQIECATPLCTNVAPIKLSAIAAAGPAVNLAIFFLCWAILQKKDLKKNTRLIVYITKQINLFLFIFNMLPIPAFDGFKVYQGLWKTFF